VDAFIAPSRFSKDKHHQMGLDVPIVHLPCFVPSRKAALRASEGALGEKSEKENFLYVGRLEKLKGLQTLIPVFRHYRKAQLLIAGTGSYEPRLRKLAEGCTNIRFLGHQSGQPLQTLYRQAMAVIVPSICFDVFPQVIVEAFRQGTPAIVRNMGGMPEIVEESGGGFVNHTEEELVAAMDQLLANPSLGRELGWRGYQAYQRRWTPEAHLERYFTLIREIAATRGHPQ
jgi:glycosyltransferase involved in cell wall biosynthesis